MNLGTWKKWIPLDGLAPMYTLISMRFWKKGHLQLILTSSCDSPRVVVTYGGNLLAYREADESLCLSTLSQAFEDAPSPWSFFTVEASPYIRDVVGGMEEQGMLHFAFVTSDVLMEVVASGYPAVEFRREQGYDARGEKGEEIKW